MLATFKECDALVMLIFKTFIITFFLQLLELCFFTHSHASRCLNMCRTRILF